MRIAPYMGSQDQLLEEAMTFNNTACSSPMPPAEVVKTAASAWAKEQAGDNWFGRGERVVLQHSEIDRLLYEAPDAFLLLTALRRHHWGPREFVIANAMAETMPGGGWRRQRFAAARAKLEAAGEIEMARPPSKANGPALYRFKVSRYGHQ
jgi:hypothetical protein